MTSITDTLLDDAVLEAIARRVAARLQTGRTVPDGLLRAAQVASRLGVKRTHHHGTPRQQKAQQMLGFQQMGAAGFEPATSRV